MALLLYRYLNSSGKIVLMPNKDDMTTTRKTMDQFMIFSQRVLTCAPMRGLSLSSKSRKTSAAGSKVTATTCTNIVMVIKGASGIKTTAPEVTSMVRYTR